MKIAVVVPCHIPPSEAWVAALKAEAEANKATVVIVDDSDGNLGPLPEDWKIFGYDYQRVFLNDLYFEFAKMFHKSSACRVFGHIWAYESRYDVVIGLDSDCIVKRNFIRDHIQFIGKDYGSGWFNPIGYPHYSRGYPYSQRHWPIVANMGVWENVLDINGKDRKDDDPKEIRMFGSTVPNGFFPFSGMNFALAREAVLFFPFLPNFKYQSDDFRRIDDVWGGYIFQRFMKHFRWSSMLGFPIVYHDTVVVAKEDAEEEEAMYKWEDDFIKSVDNAFQYVNFDNKDMVKRFESFVVEFKNTNKAFAGLYPALDWWAKAIKRYA